MGERLAAAALNQTGKDNLIAVNLRWDVPDQDWRCKAFEDQRHAGGRDKGGISKCEQTQRQKRKQMQRQMRATVDKREQTLTPALIVASYTPPLHSP